MKKTTFLEALKIGLGLIPSELFRFIKKLVVVCVFYAWIALVPMAIAFAAEQLVLTFAEHSVATLVFKILATISQIIPLSFMLYISEFELTETDEGSAELCFAICALAIAMLWLK